MPETPLTPETLKPVLETLLFITDHPVPLAEMARVVKADPAAVEAVLRELQREYEESGRPVQVLEVAEGFQMATRPQFAPFVRDLYKDKMSFRLSQAALETLSIIAYKQPLTRSEIEDIRGVEVIAALETLLEKRLIKVVGRKEVVGRPLLYGTTLEFLRHFGLKSLEEMPDLETFTPPPEPPAPAPAALPEAGEQGPEEAGAAAPAPEAETVAVADEPAPSPDQPPPGKDSPEG